MARTIPAWLGETQSSAERKLFDSLRLALPDDFTVIHSVRWLEPTEARRSALPRDWEADILVAHPRLGASLIEVKGGAVSYEAVSGRWQSRDRDGQTHQIRDPFVQAQDAAHALTRTLRLNIAYPQTWGSIGYGVAFPDGEVSTRPLQYGPSEIVIDSSAVRDHRLLQERVEALLTYWNKSQSYEVGRRALSVLVDTVAHDYRVRTLRTSVEESEHELVSLSELQFRLLECMDSNKRVAVAGCAGSGKTLLAFEKARRLAASGMRTLLTCFNRPLADHLRLVAGDEPRLLICTFHQLCVHLASQAGLKTQRGTIPNDEYYDKVLPGLLLDAVERLQPDFDAIVVDEGQNFDTAWWDYLLLTLRDSSGGTFYLFYDDNQSLYDRPLGLPPDMFSFRLQENWRNTRRIYELVSRYYSGEPVVARGPEGISVEQIGVTKKEELRTELRRVLHRCCNQEGLASDDVVVLTPRNTDRSGLLGEYGSYRLVDAPSRPNEIQLSSVFHFQGLESKVVVIAGVRNRDRDFRELMYVACSRARSHLIVIAYGAEHAAAFEADSAPSRRPTRASVNDNL